MEAQIHPSYSRFSSRQKTIKFAADGRKPTKISNPFRNTVTKVKTSDCQHINSLKAIDDDQLVEELINDEEPNNELLLSSFITDQQSEEKYFTVYEDDEDIHQPILCAMTFPLTFGPKDISTTDPVPSNIRNCNPDLIKQSILEMERD